MTQPPTDILLLGRDNYDEIVDTLCASFCDYPVMRYVLKDAGEDYDRLLRELCGWFTLKRVLVGLPAVAVKRGGKMLGAANVSPPRSIPETPEVKERRAAFAEAIGEAALARFNGFAEACEPLEPKEPHTYLGMVGVRPEHQGEGIGRLLLETVRGMSAKDPESNGVVLTTETPKNLPFYEKFGYQVLGKANAEELETWTLYRPQQTTDLNLVNLISVL